ncbi:MAG: RCC1 domain-containing protein [Gaiellaceae bacterium]
MTIAAAIRRGIAAALTGVALLALALGGSAGGATAARFSARLTATALTASQTSSNKLVYRFSKPSKSFSYRLSVRKGTKWQAIKSVTSKKKKGYFRGRKTAPLRALFAGKPVATGKYLLKLSSGSGSKQLRFEIVKPPAYVSRISAGYGHTCVVGADRGVKCWGDNSQGQLGDGTKVERPTAVTVKGLSGATQVSAAGNFTCALLSRGTVKCWGANDHGQLGDGTARASLTPVSTVGISKAIGISAGADYACALFANGRVKCWGTGPYGGEFGAPAIQIPGISTAVQISDFGGSDTCALLAGGTIKCWHSYLLGAPFDWDSLDRVTQISYGCALLSDGTVQCESYGKATRVAGISGAVQLSSNGYRGCAIFSDGSVKCWRDDYSSSGPGWTTPARVAGVSGAAQVSAGGSHTCVLLSGGAVKCWGSNSNGQLGIGAWKPFRTTPVEVKGIADGAEVSAGSGFSCAVLAGGSVDCWGDNSHGQLGNGSSGRESSILTPAPVPGISSATRVSSGFGHACALLSDGSIRCWGYNYNGQLGNGSALSDAVPNPVSVSGIANAIDIDVGAFHSCALLSGGAVKCWGAGHYGQLGDGAGSNSSTPVQVSGISDAIQLSAGSNHTCAVLSSGTVTCWGWTEAGQLGDWSYPLTPVAVSGISNATQVSVGGGEAGYGEIDSQTCALLSGGAVRCWGANRYGQLGNGTTTDSSTPVAVSGISDAREISAGDYNTCAVLAAGAIKCWGGNSSGELGNGTQTVSSTPVTVSGISSAIQVSAGERGLIDNMIHTCAVLSNHTLRCWGDNRSGGLGNGEGEYSSAPVTVLGIP